MSHEEVNDDLAIHKPYKVIACIAVHGRLPLLKHTIERLYKKNGCYKVICAGDGIEEKKLCDEQGAVWVPVQNKPLGNKWNQSFLKAKEFDPDACLFVGSSDWLSDNWISVMQPYVQQYGFTGVPGCSLVDIGQVLRGVHWAGYKNYRAERADECIGVGRMLSRRLLDAIEWQPFSSILDNSLDRSMKDRSTLKGYSDFMVYDDRLKALSLSTDLWPNKHKFYMHWDILPNGSQMIPSEKMSDVIEWCSKHFPEVLELQKTLYP